MYVIHKTQCNKVHIFSNSLIENSSLLDFFYSKWDEIRVCLASDGVLDQKHLWPLACVFLWNLKFSGVCLDLCAAITL